MRARLRDVDLPLFGTSARAPELGHSIYQARLARLRDRVDRDGFDRLVVYADREHSANLAWLTGFDPRFEEAVLVLGTDDRPAILVGNECRAMAAAAPLPMRPILYQELSLPSQPRDRSRPLAAILADEGIRPGSRVGVVGGKASSDPGWLDVPAFLADELRSLVGASGAVGNTTNLDVLPFSNMPAYLPPFLLRPDRAMTLAD